MDGEGWSNGDSKADTTYNVASKSRAFKFSSHYMFIDFTFNVKLALRSAS